jgi:hypothetical protein
MPSAPEPDAIDLPRFAEIMAHLRHFPADRRAELLARLGVAEPAWAAAAARWSAARDADLDRGASDVARRFGVAFARTLRRLEAERPALESCGPLPAPPPPPAAAPVPVPAVVAAPSPAPSFMQIAPRGAGLGETMGVSTRPRSKTLPFRMPPDPARREAPAIPLDAGPRPAVPEGVPDFTLPQYASLRVELDVGTDHADATLARYGVPRAAKDALDAYWRLRFEADPLLRMMFAKAYATYLGWFRENGRAPRA